MISARWFVGEGELGSQPSCPTTRVSSTSFFENRGSSTYCPPLPVASTATVDINFHYVNHVWRVEYLILLLLSLKNILYNYKN